MRLAAVDKVPWDYVAVLSVLTGALLFVLTTGLRIAAEGQTEKAAWESTDRGNLPQRGVRGPWTEWGRNREVPDEAMYATRRRRASARNVRKVDTVSNGTREFSRRHFLQGAGVFGAGVLGAAALGGCAPQTQQTTAAGEGDDLAATGDA